MALNHIAEEFDRCIKCGLCQATCPVCKELFLEKYAPRGKVQLAKCYSRGDLDLSSSIRDIFARCLSCETCSATCPSGVDLKKVYKEMRAEIGSKTGLHPAMEEMVRAISAKHNISGEDNTERAGWIDQAKEVPEHRYQKNRAQVAYFVGCMSSFFPTVQKIPASLCQLMAAAKVDFTVLGGEEWCCGSPLLNAGVPEKMETLIEHNLERVKALGARSVFFSCPSCFRTWKEHYDTDLELLHDTQFIEKLIHDGVISFRRMDMTVTYHDPCDLGRKGGVFDAPRQILRSIPGLTLVELENSRTKSVCCGGGGNLEMADPGLSGAVAQKKIEEIQRTGAKTVVTSCQQCVRTIKGQAGRQKVALDVMDITELVFQAMSPVQPA
jgi:heterodisulfide reductase subunit D